MIKWWVHVVSASSISLSLSLITLLIDFSLKTFTKIFSHLFIFYLIFFVQIFTIQNVVSVSSNEFCQKNKTKQKKLLRWLHWSTRKCVHRLDFWLSRCSTCGMCPAARAHRTRRRCSQVTYYPLARLSLLTRLRQFSSL